MTELRADDLLVHLDVNDADATKDVPSQPKPWSVEEWWAGKIKPSRQIRGDAVQMIADDARTAQDAGARFARALVDVGSADLMVALDDQQGLMQRAIVDAGFSGE